jgi:hypothetical protein
MYSHFVRPIVARLLVEDQRYDPAFKVGSYVRIVRPPYEFEVREMLANEEEGIYEFPVGMVGNITETNGIFVWIETPDAYYHAHINCLELVPDNYVVNYSALNDNHEHFGADHEE